MKIKDRRDVLVSLSVFCIIHDVFAFDKHFDQTSNADSKISDHFEVKILNVRCF